METTEDLINKLDSLFAKLRLGDDQKAKRSLDRFMMTHIDLPRSILLRYMLHVEHGEFYYDMYWSRVQHRFTRDELVAIWDDMGLGPKVYDRRGHPIDRLIEYQFGQMSFTERAQYARDVIDGKVTLARSSVIGLAFEFLPYDDTSMNDGVPPRPAPIIPAAPESPESPAPESPAPDPTSPVPESPEDELDATFQRISRYCQPKAERIQTISDHYTVLSNGLVWHLLASLKPLPTAQELCACSDAHALDSEMHECLRVMARALARNEYLHEDVTFIQYVRDNIELPKCNDPVRSFIDKWNTHHITADEASRQQLIEQLSGSGNPTVCAIYRPDPYDLYTSSDMSVTIYVNERADTRLEVVILRTESWCFRICKNGDRISFNGLGQDRSYSTLGNGTLTQLPLTELLESNDLKPILETVWTWYNQA